MKKTLLLILLSGVSLCLKAQTLEVVFKGGTLAVKNEKGIIKMLLKKTGVSDNTINLPDGSYSSKDIFKNTYNKLLSLENMKDTTGVNKPDKLDSIYKEVKRLYEQKWKSLFKITESTPTIMRATISPSLSWDFTPKDKSFEMNLCVISNDNRNCFPKGGFEVYVSKREFGIMYDSLANLLQSKNDSIVHKDQLSQLIFIKDTIYTNLKNWIATSDKNPLINVTELKYNDTLKAYLTVRSEIPIYRVLYKSTKQKSDSTKTDSAKKDSAGKGNAKTKYGSPEKKARINSSVEQANPGYNDQYELSSNGYRNVKVGTVKIVDANIQVEDGFIIGITFHIDPDSALKYSLKPDQSYRGRYNIRNIMLAGYYLNRGYPIYFQKELFSFNTQKNSLKSQTDSLNYVYLITDLLDYKSPMNAPNANFTAQETLINVPKDSLNKPLPLKEKSLYAFANLDIYSDLLGLFNQNNPNGLVQTELKIGTALFRRPIMRSKNYKKRSRPDRALFTPLNKAEIFFRFSKLDDKVKYLDVQRLNNDYANPPFVHGVNLLQYQSMNYGVRANLLNLDYRGGNTAITGEASIYRTPLRDSVITKKDSTTVVKTPETLGINSTSLSIGVSSRIHAATFLDIDFSARYMYIKPRIDTVKLSNTSYNEFYKNNKFVAATSAKFINYKAMTNIYLNDEKSKRIILRFEYYFDIRQKSNSFSTIQVGYSAYLDKFLNLAPDKSKK